MPDDTPQMRPTESDSVRPRPTVSDHDGQRPTMSATRSDQHTMTTSEVVKMFEDAALPREKRSIERYCEQGKLDCFKDPDEMRYYITRGSADQLIGHLKELKQRHEQPGAPTASPPADDMQRPSPTTDAAAAVKRGTPEKHDGKQPAGEYEYQLEAMEKRIKELENEKFHLLIDKSAKEQVITTLREHMTDDRKDYTAQITHFAHRVGKLETEMRQLTAPDRDRRPTPDDRQTADDDAAIDAEYRDANATTHEHHHDVSTNASPA